MQCLRINRDDTPVPTPSSLSLESLDKYFERTLNRRSFLRRSFDLVRKNVIRHSQHLSRKTSRTGHTLGGRSFSDDDKNNNHHPSSIRSRKYSGGTYGVGGDAFAISTDCDISMLKLKKHKQRRLKKG